MGHHAECLRVTFPLTFKILLYSRCCDWPHLRESKLRLGAVECHAWGQEMGLKSSLAASRGLPALYHHSYCPPSLPLQLSSESSSESAILKLSTHLWIILSFFLEMIWIPFPRQQRGERLWGWLPGAGAAVSVAKPQASRQQSQESRQLCRMETRKQTPPKGCTKRENIC